MLADLKLSPEYYAYLASSEWQQRREQALWRAGKCCQLCNSSNHLDVHHRTYERFMREIPEDLTVLCRSCHEKFHDRMPKPPFPVLKPASRAQPRGGPLIKTPDVLALACRLLPSVIESQARRAGRKRRHKVRPVSRLCLWLVGRPDWPVRFVERQDLWDYAKTNGVTTDFNLGVVSALWNVALRRVNRQFRRGKL